ncbi:hypothetical protein OESDEN_20942 [Oesophagostomum dentatum]|uniref:Uncharacterized protein n=1 Tax=Oesophagostomum dentatum TaxID=61180 RepID=A0A0B1S7A8_OESDE|nr:hypothetical protein OESDEN_20942 [Oesophagostomum dentatum]
MEKFYVQMSAKRLSQRLWEQLATTWLRYNCSREQQAYLISTNETFGEMGETVKCNNTQINRSIFSVDGDGVTLEGFLAGAIPGWHLDNMSYKSEFDCNRHIKRLNRTSRRQHKVVCVYA